MAWASSGVGVILVILDGLAAKRIAEAWATAPASEQPAALRLVLAEATINFALAALFNILFAGVTFILYGLAVAWSRVYPRAGLRRRVHHRDEDPDDHLPNGHHPVAGEDGRAGAPEGAVTGARRRWRVEVAGCPWCTSLAGGDGRHCRLRANRST
jgi:hypothetical protein